MDLSVGMRFDHELLAVERDHTVSCMLELTAPPAVAAEDRRPLAIALVIDRSGSMHGDKLAVTRLCGVFLMERLSAADQLALVTFDDEVRLDAPLTQVGPARAGLTDAIRGIFPGGQTNLSGGWLKGVETLAQLEDGSHTRRVLLLTDGLANVGITDEEQLAKMTRSSAADGIGTTTIGFGEGFSEELLTAMADAGGGGAHFAAQPDDAPGIFAEEFEDLMSLVAQNVSAEIRPAWDEVELLEVLNTYPQVPVEGGVQVQLGDAYGEEERRVVFQLHVPAIATLGPSKVADVVLRYVTVGEEVAMHELTVPVIVNAVSAEEAAAVVPDAEVTEQVVILSSAKAQEHARALALEGDTDSAAQLLRDAADKLREIAPASMHADELIRHAEATEWHLGEVTGEFTTLSSKRMKYESRLRSHGRRMKDGSS